MKRVEHYCEVALWSSRLVILAAVIASLLSAVGLVYMATVDAYYMLALAYWQQKDLEGALAPAKAAVDLTTEPQESWLQLLLAVYLTAKDYDSAIPIYDVLVRRYPKKSYWIQLSTLHGALGNYVRLVRRNPEAVQWLMLCT